MKVAPPVAGQLRQATIPVLLALHMACGTSEPTSSPTGPEPDVTSELRVGPEGSDEALDLSALTREATPVEVRDPYETRAVTFMGVPAELALDRAFGRAWRDAEEVVFVCADGYRAGVPARRFLEHHAYLALARRGRDFVIDKEIGGTTHEVSLAPAYLVWENQRDAVVRAEGDFGWPYQIVAIELATLEERYGRLRPPLPDDPTARAEVERGFAAFRRHCVRCHAINGQGGQVGPELNYPASVTEYIAPEFLSRFLLDPLSVRAGTPMPGLPRDLPGREATARDVIAYLRAIAGRKLSPGDPRTPRPPGAMPASAPDPAPESPPTP